MKGKTSAKAKLRTKMRQALNTLSESTRATQSQSICDQLPLLTGSKIAIFAHLTSEVRLLSLVESSPHIEWFLPRILSDSEIEFLPIHELRTLKKGPFGIMEPSSGIPVRELDIIVCPGLAFTARGDRLGQGGGFYDRALTQFPTARAIGVCFDCQLLDTLPSEPHDAKMAQVITARQGF